VLEGSVVGHDALLTATAAEFAAEEFNRIRINENSRQTLQLAGDVRNRAPGG